MSGRTRGPRLVRELEGSEQAKERLETILETMAGTIPVQEACRRLDIGEAMFHRLRKRVLEAGLAGLEPRPRGRRPSQRPADEVRQLEEQVRHLEQELQLAEVRRELAAVLPHVVRAGDSEVKKTTQRSKRRPPKRRRKKPR